MVKSFFPFPSPFHPSLFSLSLLFPFLLLYHLLSLLFSFFPSLPFSSPSILEMLLLPPNMSLPHPQGLEYFSTVWYDLFVWMEQNLVALSAECSVLGSLLCCEPLHSSGMEQSSGAHTSTSLIEWMMFSKFWPPFCFQAGLWKAPLCPFVPTLVRGKGRLHCCLNLLSVGGLSMSL